jgi:hypothetical protein
MVMADPRLVKLRKYLFPAARELERYARPRDPINPPWEGVDPPCKADIFGAELQITLHKTAAWLRYIPTMLESMEKRRKPARKRRKPVPKRRKARKPGK